VLLTPLFDCASKQFVNVKSLSEMKAKLTFK